MGIKIERLNETGIRLYYTEIIEYYFSNIKLCNYLETFTYEDAKAKIDSLINHQRNGDAIVFGAINEDKSICGYIWAYKYRYREENRVYINEIRVSEEYRKRGVATKLISAVEKVANEIGVQAVYIHAEGDNKKAQNLYIKEGYNIERIQLRKQIK
ncbi:MAG: GNAT family N-acetyltransferase [Firmicutes bacterium]|nr:GNAT family N-acetyltransferase [Bacillota bacterium]